jgi:fatty acid desaturase
MQRVLAGLALFAPTVGWAGFNIGKNLDYVLLLLPMVAVSAVMGLMLLLSLFSSTSCTTQSFKVCAANLLVIGFLLAVGDQFSAFLLAVAGGVLLLLTVLVYFGESMLAASKAKQRAADRLAQRKSLAQKPSEPAPQVVERPWR